ncbi:Fc.00g084810.m01.CDS01 [Cosmosporella sp. VM-42]
MKERELNNLTKQVRVLRVAPKHLEAMLRSGDNTMGDLASQAEGLMTNDNNSSGATPTTSQQGNTEDDTEILAAEEGKARAEMLGRSGLYGPPKVCFMAHERLASHRVHNFWFADITVRDCLRTRSTVLWPTCDAAGTHWRLYRGVEGPRLVRIRPRPRHYAEWTSVYANERSTTHS